MTPKLKVALSFGMAVMLSSLGLAQAPPAGGARGTATVGQRGGSGGSFTVQVPRFPLSVTVGAPYSAVQEFERTQTLVDGTHIVQKGPTTRFYRDSQGRTRTERPMFWSSPPPTESVTLIQIDDPVAGLMYVLDVQNHVAHRAKLPTADAAPPLPPHGNAGVVVSAKPSSGGAVTTNVGNSAAASENLRASVSSESLGSQEIEGVYAVGTRNTTTWPVGSRGNDRPLVRTCETWYSPELKLIVLSQCSDPLSGETVARLTNIDRSEPDPALFQPPADYTIVDDEDRITIQYTRP